MNIPGVTPRTVEGVLKTLLRAVAQLEQVVSEQVSLADSARSSALTFEAMADSAEAEAAHAARVKAKLEELLA